MCQTFNRSFDRYMTNTVSNVQNSNNINVLSARLKKLEGDFKIIMDFVNSPVPSL
jgi:hypothetical protein